MIKVQAKGDRIRTADPARPGVVTEMQNIVFIEEGRDTTNKALNESSKLLDNALGLKTGLVGTRTHTQPVTLEAAEQIQVGQEIAGMHITRELWSTPQIRNQIDKDPRLVDGMPTYITTKFSSKVEDDIDHRPKIDVLASVNPSQIFSQHAQIGATEELRMSADGSNERRVGPDMPTLPGGSRVASAATGNPLGANPNVLANVNTGGDVLVSESGSQAVGSANTVVENSTAQAAGSGGDATGNSNSGTGAGA